MPNLTQELMKFGLSEKETEVYLASLALGPASVQNLAKKANVNRVTTYVMIDQLTKKGLLSNITRGKKKLYIPERPERILGIIHEREREVQDQMRQFETVLPELKSLMAASSEKPIVRFYEGIEGFKSIRQEVQNRPHGSFCQLIVPSLSKNVFPPGSSSARDKVHEKIKSGEMRARILSVGDDQVRREFFKNVPSHELKFLSPVKYPFSFEFGVYGPCVVLYLVKGDYIGILIEDEQVAKNFQLLFDLAWEAATPTPQQ